MMIFTSKRRSRSDLQPPMLFPSAPTADRTATQSVVEEPKDLDAISVTARWLILTTDISRSFSRALLPESFEVPERPSIAVWIVEPLSADSDEVGVPQGRLFAGMSCSCLLPGEQDESAFTSDLLVGAPIVDEDRNPFALPELPQAELSLVNGVGGMGFAIPPADGGGRGLLGRVELSECGSEQVQLTPDWLACQSWRTDLVEPVGVASSGDSGDVVRTQWELTRLSPIVTGSAVVECAEFGPRAYDLSSAASLDARYGFARVAILGRQAG
ncbi:hypothetical protein [Prescottella agglutinans]|uniref:Uncharacterized protein n=1 Tax=Prescottella agglutinans TaxID=1644129 RepID=A0ABT6M560_9NOCA|nr:hypothetical protein [Prescottella agglutinans]MDH6278886.1 hypothetical protein [Prescottella agglutinans]